MINYAENIDKNLLQKSLSRKLDLLERYCEIDILITSGLRSQEKNAEVGGSPTSSHLKGLAVDIFCDNGVMYGKIRKYAEWAGFTRFGHGEKHIHLDCDPEKPQNCEWWEK